MQAAAPSFAVRGPVGVVIAHPDDESMFFAPALASLARNGERALVLCLSSGDFYGLGQTRKRELEKACAVLGVQKEDVFIVEHPELQDGSPQPWPMQVVASHVRDFVHKHGVKTLLTFDERGISGHSDHSAVHRGVVHFLREKPRGARGTNISNVIPSSSSCGNNININNSGHGSGSGSGLNTGSSHGKVLDAFELTSTGMVRKYSGILDLPLSLLLSQKPPLGAFFVSFSVRRAWRAMAAHRSQFVWYRRLFVIFSRYAYVNTFRRIPPI